MQPSIFNRIRIVLVGTTHPGNIGATARAMKTMGFSRLTLVNPKTCLNAESTARASGADDILMNVAVHESLDDAIRNCGLVYGTSARLRSLPWPEFDPRQASARIIEYAASSTDIAIAFGRESSGLSNTELEKCSGMIVIPADCKFNSLNIASAVQIICYEIRKAVIDGLPEGPDSVDQTALITYDKLDKLYHHLQECLVEVGYLDPTKPRLLMRRLKRLFTRAQLDENEYNILRGVLTEIQLAIRKDRD